MSAIPKVSVCMITYNHERFIAQAIESVLEQKTAFDFELVIGEDCSTDNTRTIVMTYSQKYPNQIRALIREKNIGTGQNLFKTINECKGQYIAHLDGDDYWTDPLKLQKQVDFLDAHPSYSLCCHCYKIYDEENKEWDRDDGNQKLFADADEGKDITADIFFDYRIDWLIHGLTAVFRKEMLDIDILARYKYLCDVPLFYHLITKGKCRRFNFIGGVYRKHGSAIFSKKSAIEKAELIYLIYKELYDVTKSPLVKKYHLAVYTNFIYCTIRNTKRPFFRKKLYYHIFKLFLLSPGRLMTKAIKFGYRSFHTNP
jgi:glycosyltransferase involved in cell wall biosynthesis